MSTDAINKIPVLDLQNLRTEFEVNGHWNPSVRDVSLTIGANETVAVVGESGSGKSVTALSIMRLLPSVGARIASGKILFRGEDLTGYSEQQIREIRGNRIAMIFQEPMTSLNPTMKAGVQIAESLMVHRQMSETEARSETIRQLERVRIPNALERYDEYPHQFSGGMRQRIMIAMALACRPNLLIADEPTTALDVTIQVQILELIKQLQDEEQMAVLFITHDMGVVAEVADRAVVMREGAIVEQGSCEGIFSRPQHPYTRTLINAVPRLGALAGQRGPVAFPELDSHGQVVVPDGHAVHGVVPGGEPILSVRNLSTRFPIRGGLLRRERATVHAVENVSFDLYPGETLALVGESGCGKSTTGRSILRLLEPLAGEVLVEGKDVRQLSEAELARMRVQMQMIFQDPYASLNPRQSVADAIREPLLYHKICDRPSADASIAELLDRVGLPADSGGRYPHEFSGGQRQRICIARALALGPKLIVADEAVSALDVSIKAQIVNLMMELQASLGLAYLFISHDMAVVERISHRVAVMYLGEIVEIGPRADVFGNPQHPYTKKLLSSVLVPDPARRRKRRPLSNDEIGNAVRRPDFVPPRRTYKEVAPAHLVQDWTDDPNWTLSEELSVN